MGEVLCNVLVFVQVLYYSALLVKVVRDLRSGSTRTKNDEDR